ncbi:MAG: flagellar basal body P-ring formation chaperone FlgA [Mariprofundaceae bacterium]
MTLFFRALMIFAMLMPTMALADAMKDSLHRFFAQGIHHQGATADLIEVVRWPDTTGVIKWRLPTLNRHSSRVALIAEQTNGSKMRRWYVPVRLRWWADVVGLKQDLANRTLLDASMLQVQKKDIAGHVGHWWTKISEVEGMRLTRPLHKGDVVYSAFVKRPPLIQRGDIVTIIAKYGNLSIRAEGRAMKAAGKGERLLVMNVRSKQRLQAVVLDAATVLVRSGGAG